MTTKTDCPILALANVVLPTPEDADLRSPRVVPGDRALLIGQTLPATNGIYVATTTGSALLTGSESYDEGTGEYTVSGLTPGLVYSWRPGYTAYNLTNGTDVLTSAGWFMATGSSVILNGEPGEDVHDSLYVAALARASDADASADWAESFTVLGGERPYQWTAVEGFVLGTTGITFSALSTNPGIPWVPDVNDPTTTPAPVGSAVPLSTDTGVVLFGSDGTPLLLHY